MLLYLSTQERDTKTRYAPVAQLDRVTDYESVGRGFESLPAYQDQNESSGPFCYILSSVRDNIPDIHRTDPGTRRF